MKKLLSILLIASFLAFPVHAKKDNRATLINVDTGEKIIVTIGTWPSTGKWIIWKDLMLGETVSTGFTSKLTSSITAGATTIYLAKTTDINGIALPCSSINKCYFNIEPGGARQEPILCTGVSGLSLTGCTRGLLATGNSETGSSTFAYAHNAGATIIMTNIAQFYSNFVDLQNNQTVGGIKDFTSIPTSTTTTPTADGQLATKKYVDDVTNAGAADATESVKGISELAVGQEAASSTLSGTAARLVIPTSITTSTAGTAYTIPVTGGSGTIASGFYQGNTNTWSGVNTFTSTSTFSGNSIMATTTFNVLPTIPTSTPASTQTVSKYYGDINYVGKYATTTSGTSTQFSSTAEASSTSNVIKSFTLLIAGFVNVTWDQKVSTDDGNDTCSLAITDYTTGNPTLTNIGGCTTNITSYVTKSYTGFLMPGSYTLTVSNDNGRTVYIRNLYLIFGVANAYPGYSY